VRITGWKRTEGPIAIGKFQQVKHDIFLVMFIRRELIIELEYPDA